MRSGISLLHQRRGGAFHERYPLARFVLTAAALAGLLAVALGAFGAHGLKTRLTPDMLAVFQTAVQYHFYHVLALLLVAVLMFGRPDLAGLGLSALLFGAGLVLFSGSLYVLAVTGIRWLGAITPLGGLAFMGGWLALAWAGFRSGGGS